MCTFVLVAIVLIPGSSIHPVEECALVDTHLASEPGCRNEHAAPGISQGLAFFADDLRALNLME
jgi:hypothetical protein